MEISCEIVRVSLNVGLIGFVIFGYISTLSSLADVQKHWIPEWNDLVGQPEFSYGVEGFKLKDVRALSFFYSRKYALIPDPEYNNCCMKTRNKLIAFPSILFLLAISLLALPC